MTHVKPFRAWALFAALFFSAPVFSQIDFKLQWLQDSLAWGVFATPSEGARISNFVIIGSGQATIVAPKGTMFANVKNFSGTWEQNARVDTPKENPGKDYISFGLVTADPPMQFIAGVETLLFTFTTKTGDCPETLGLIAANDPFNKVPNSANANPGNDISVLDPQTQIIFQFNQVYAPDAWDCHPGKVAEQGPFHHGLMKKKPQEVNRP
ncbi:MAG: hypothetical protein H6577_10505 [Lewinellaceae bacterium]|nr:hypothetical protein [Saprospiraceae bacterium]MCB9338543.1 hypothetical protein [Lewinellaceae bacterium]